MRLHLGKQWLPQLVVLPTLSTFDAVLSLGLSIRRQQGLQDFAHFNAAMVTTLGMRLSWRRWNELLANANVWNRRYVDFFVAMDGTLVLSHLEDAGTLQSMVTLVHPIAPYSGVDYFNALLQNPNSGFYRLFHIPIPAHFGARC